MRKIDTSFNITLTWRRRCWPVTRLCYVTHNVHTAVTVPLDSQFNSWCYQSTGFNFLINKCFCIHFEFLRKLFWINWNNYSHIFPKQKKIFIMRTKIRYLYSYKLQYFIIMIGKLIKDNTILVIYRFFPITYPFINMCNII